MNIGLIHFRVGETDGVSLEMEKWKLILEELGHKVWYIAGSGDVEDVLCIKEFHYQNEINELLVNHIYKRIKDDYSESQIKDIYKRYARDIEVALEKTIRENRIDLIMPNNMLSLGWNIAAGKAIHEVIKKTKIQVIAHHHDFYWERELYNKPKYDWVKEILEESFPPKDDNVRHVVINNIAKRAMKVNKNLESKIVPNVFDFEQNWMIKDQYNENIKEDLGFKKSDIILLQGTRIVARKGIELTLRSLKMMNELLPAYIGKQLYDGSRITPSSRIKLVLAGNNEEDDYLQKLTDLAKAQSVDLVDVSHRIDFVRFDNDGIRNYSLWDAYQLADIVSYPSLLEGFGNQLLEAIYARKPILLYEYPVYNSYLRDFGIKTISYGNEHILDENGLAVIDEDISRRVASKCLEILTSKEAYERTTQGNYSICLQEFSYKKLKELLEKLLKSN